MNPVAKHAHKFNRSTMFSDKKKQIAPSAENYNEPSIRDAHYIYLQYCRRNSINLSAAYQAGMISKSSLSHGVAYVGYCRSYFEAVWDAKNNVFVGLRTKFGQEFEQFTVHPEDDEGFDVFVPVKEKE